MKKAMLLAAMLVTVLAAAVPAALGQVPQEEEPADNTTVGYITSISGTQIYVEEEPSIGLPRDPATGYPICEGKIYLTVTRETSILQLQGGELIPASFEDLDVGQLVSATDTGVLTASCPPQGGADSIVILDEFPGFEGRDTGLEQYDPAV